MGGFGVKLPHFMLLQFVAAEDDEFLGAMFTQEEPGEFSAEGAGSTGHQHR
jgi:hypothetical protein